MNHPRQMARGLDYEVRPARAADLAAIQTVARRSWHKAYARVFATRVIKNFLAHSYGAANLRAELANRRATFLVAWRRGRVLGFCHFGERGGGPELFRLYIDPDFWGRGIGRRLISHAEMRFLVVGARRYFLTVHRRNTRAILFYIAMGFTHDRGRDHRDEWYMAKVLRPAPV